MDQLTTCIGLDEAVGRIRPGRVIEGISAILLPFDQADRPDLAALAALIERTYAAGITPAVNMDTGYVNLLDPAQRSDVLSCAREVSAGRRFVAGAFIEGEPGDPVALYRREIESIERHGGTPILFQSSALNRLSNADVVSVYRRVAESSRALLAFELGEMFAPFGRIYPLDIVRGILDIPAIGGIKHSSLDRVTELQRLALRDRVRPDFKIYTGNDLAIDMVFYGSDYLLGLSAFHVEAFALRDRLWHQGDAAALGLNDLLQYLGFLAFRPPVPAYKHTAAQFLHLRGLIPNSKTHPRSARRPDSDVEILRDIAARLDAVVALGATGPARA